MKGRFVLRVAAFFIVSLSSPAQVGKDWHDPSPHRVQFVPVQEGVRLEVLDWGGTGRAAVLLAGSGNTAHVFDDFAPKLTGFCHVYGITRRGFGASSQPETGYDEPRLAEDILQVLNALSIQAPVLVGHSMAGGEMTVLASQHSDRLGGLIYIDALFDVADYPASDPAFMAIVKKLPRGGGPKPATPEEQRSFAAYRAMQMRNEGFAFPESELRNTTEPTADGSRGRYKTPRSVFKAVGDGAKPRDYSKIRVPVLSMNETQRAPGDYGTGPQPPEEERAIQDEYRTAAMAFLNRWKKNLQSGVPSVRFVDFPASGHYIFMTREAEVIGELKSFMMHLHS